MSTRGLVTMTEAAENADLHGNGYISYFKLDAFCLLR